MSLVAGHPVGYQSTGSSEQRVGSPRGQKGRLGEEEMGFRERRVGERGGETEKKGKKGKNVKRKEKRKNPQQEKAHRREAASGAHLHPWDGWRVGPG